MEIEKVYTYQFCDKLQISIYPVNDIDSVFKTIPKEYFANDLGGKAPSFEDLKGTYTSII